MTQDNNAGENAGGTSSTLTIRGNTGNRVGSSRKLLARKAASMAHVPAGEALEDVFPRGDASEVTSEAIADTGAVIADSSAIVAADPGADLASDGAEDAAIATVEYIAPAAASEAPAATIAAAPSPASATPASEPESAPSEPAALAPADMPAAAPAWSPEDESALNAMLARRKAAGYQRRGKDVGGQLVRVGDISPNPDTVVAVVVGLVAAAGGAVPRATLLELMAGAAFPHPRAQPQDKGWCQGYVAGAVRNGFLTVEGERPSIRSDGAEVGPNARSGEGADAGVSIRSGNCDASQEAAA